MRVVRAHLVNYRNWRTCNVAFAERLTVLVGPNGSGKTNLVESVYLAAYGRVLRGKDSDAVRWGEREASAEVRFRADGGTESIVRARLSASGKEIAVNGRVVESRGELVGRFPLVFCSGADEEIVRGEPEFRRRFLDALGTLVNPEYLPTLREYLRSVKQRNRLLLQAGQEGLGRVRAGLEAWDEQLVRLGERLLRKRLRYLQELEPYFAEFYGKLSGESAEGRLVYLSTVPLGGGEVAEKYRAELARRSTEERLRGMTLVGPHRDDFRIEVAGIDYRRFASRGQVKLASLALRLAQATMIARARDERPVVVIDDAFSELDDEKAGRALEALADYQVILATAEEARVERILTTWKEPVGILRAGGDRIVAEVRP
ncbi:MAG: DNA replication and repair protein RecF [candidate division KSB1 bacterium]|nr:DNA replication and repair protein RecF [candidate division KSB1 bacterium]